MFPFQKVSFFYGYNYPQYKIAGPIPYLKFYFLLGLYEIK